MTETNFPGSFMAELGILDGNYSNLSSFTPSSSINFRSCSLSDASSFSSRFFKYTKAVPTSPTNSMQTTNMLSIFSANKADKSGANTTYVKIVALSSSSCWLGRSSRSKTSTGFRPEFIAMRPSCSAPLATFRDSSTSSSFSILSASSRSFFGRPSPTILSSSAHCIATDLHTSGGKPRAWRRGTWRRHPGRVR